MQRRLAVVHTTLAFTLYTFGIRHPGAGRAAIVATIEPVVAGILGVTLLAQVRPGKAQPGR